jgi:peptidoglycan/LPS O-acetylase OafA/YrhL
MKQGSGRLRGLAQVRLGLVLIVIGVQSLEVSQSFGRLAYTPLWILGPAAIAGLFACLGFSLAASRDERDGPEFLARSAIRAIPAMLFAMIGAFAVLGPLVSSIPVPEYFTRSESWAYLLNLALLPRSGLPGVFEFNNLANVVNEITWVFPAFVLTVASGYAATGRRRDVMLVGGTFTILLAAGLADYAGLLSDPFALSSTHRFLARSIGAISAGQFGIACFLLRDRIAVSLPLAVAAAALVGAIAVFGDRSWADMLLAQYGIGVVCAYLAIYVATLRLPSPAGVTLLAPLVAPLFAFSFPIQQLVIQFGSRDQSWLMNFIIALPLTVLLGLAFELLIARPLIALLYRHAAMPPPAPLQLANFSPNRNVLRQRLGEQAPTILILMLLITFVLVALALTVFAMQPASGG